VLSILSVSNARADCGKLGPGDTFAQLNVILECQEQRIKALEQKQGAARSGVVDSAITPPAETVWTNGKCFPYKPNQAFKLSITIEEQHEPLVLCWGDGTVMARINRFKQESLQIADPSNRLAKARDPHKSALNGCRYNAECIIITPEATISVTPQLLAGSDTLKRARLRVETRPN
jgi:hypothetical protein